MTSIALGSGGEFDRIRAIADALGDQAGALGDDTATLPPGEGSVVVSIDVSVEDVHFRRHWLTAEEIGWRAAASALSDLAAAAATPIGIVAAVVVPHLADETILVAVMRGIGAVASSVGAQVIGGDLSSGDKWTIAITVFGRTAQAMSRVGAKPGDGIWVTGSLGGARAALEAWLKGMEPEPAARQAFAHPVPRIDAAHWLTAHGASAMMDLSDGLGGDADHLAQASGVELQIELERVPPHPGVALVAQHLGEEPALFAASSGEDYELLVTLPADFADALQFEQTHGIPLTRIGTVASGLGVRATLAGEIRVVRGFRHAI